MKYDIYISEQDKSRQMRIPWLPEKIAFRSGGARFAEYDILSLGQVRLIYGQKLGSVQWSSTLPGQAHADLPFLRGSWQDPKKYQELWASWLKKGTPLRLLIPNTPINFDVLLADYSVTYAGAFGDYQYSIELCDRREITVTSTQEKNKTSSTAAKPRPTAPKAATYTIRPGDTLWAIAARPDVYGSGTRWPELYQLNKTVLDNEAARRGLGSGMGSRYIFSGTIITLPGGGGT